MCATLCKLYRFTHNCTITHGGCEPPVCGETEAGAQTAEEEHKYTHSLIHKHPIPPPSVIGLLNDTVHKN